MSQTLIVATGSYLPQKVLTNHDLAKTVDTSDEFIITRTGIRARHIAAEGELTSDMAIAAAKHALEQGNISADSIDVIIVATTTPDYTFPSTAVRVQAGLGVRRGAAFDIQAVCAGFVYGVSVAHSMIAAGLAKTALVIGADKMSSIVDWTDRNTCILFGDGAGAVILQAKDAPGRGILSSALHADGQLQDILHTTGGVGLTQAAGTVTMQGKEVFKHASDKMCSCVEEVLAANRLTSRDIRHLIPHQANSRIMEMVAKKLHLSEEQVVSTVEYHANTSAASIPLAMDVAHRQSRFTAGDTIALTALGGGLVWGAILLKW